MINVDTGEVLQGDFEPTNIVENPGAPSYAGHTSLSRDNEILQFLHGNADTLSFTVRVYAATFPETFFVEDEINLLKSWKEKIDRVAAPPRPPIIVFTIGTAAIYMECIIESVSNIRYDRFTFGGSVRGATIDVSLRQYVPFEISGTYIHETRYHRAKEGDYYEMLCHYEYGSANIGDLVRRRHPDKVDIMPADIIKMPSVSALKAEKVLPHSYIFSDSFVSRDTPQRRLREEFLELRSGSYVSHIVN